jgi:hypothetical protein
VKFAALAKAQSLLKTALARFVLIAVPQPVAVNVFFVTFFQGTHII